ncbi:MAG: NOP58 family protein [Nanoarchaeota archaeon]|nr:NOP58 family protein [Nanoarchaeota archaeon]
MNKYIFTNILGVFIFNEHYRLKDKIMFSNPEDYLKRENIVKRFSQRYQEAVEPEGKALLKILDHFKEKQYHDNFYRQNLNLTKKLIKEAVQGDTLVMQAINSVDDISKISNVLAKRLREWYGYYNPEFNVENPEAYVELILRKSKQELIKEGNVSNPMGAELEKQDIIPIMDLAKELKVVYELRKKHEEYLDKLMIKVCPNVTAIVGSKIGAKLLNQAGSLKSMMEFPASTIQLLGAEKAFFRHLKTGAKSPKFGFIHEHILVSNAKMKDKGKVARAIADKVAIAAKIDYFKGKFIGDEMRKKLEAKFR